MGDLSYKTFYYPAVIFNKGELKDDKGKVV